VVALIGLNTICLFFYRQLEYVAYAQHRSPLLTLAEETVGGLAGLSVFALIYLTAIRSPLLSPRWRRNLLFHLLALAFISVLHTSLIWLYRSLLFPLLGFDESYGYMPARYPMEFSHLFIYYWVSVSLIYLFHEVRFAGERELRQAKLETSLAEAQLHNLQLQLQPHFLFNALNAISTAIYEDPQAADEMVGRLGELLRQLLKEDPSQFIPLERELETLQLYTRIMEARLEHRLRIAFEIDDAVRAAPVPQLILQPLVENAIRHGMNSRFEANVVVRAQCENGSLILTVRDHGPGIPPPSLLRNGIGLQNTTDRLRKLYGEQQSFSLRNAQDGGAVAEVRIPRPLAIQNEWVSG
jgi:two-component system LytT family sensor kinase